jgi:hypothetical protein
LAIAVFAVACVQLQDPAMPLVRARAEKDLRCPSDNLEIESQLGGKYRVDGCGRTATYDTACDNLQCTVSAEDGEAPAWRDRPVPGSLEAEH